MLDNLRAMGVFACVVECGSFSGAAKQLGITTSAVSQQIRGLEDEMNVTLLHRSTRKIALTEAGQSFFQSCQEMMAAAERGKIRISELQDNLVGELRIATTPELAAMHIVPALSHWIKAHTGLTVRFIVGHQYVDLIDDRIDIAIRMSSSIEYNEYDVCALAKVEQILIASPTYLHQHVAIKTPHDLVHHQLLPVDLMTDAYQFTFSHLVTDERISIEMPVKIRTNNIFVMKSLCQYGHGIGRILSLDAQQELRQGDLVEVLSDWKLPQYILHAVILKREQQPVKVLRCLDALKQYFTQHTGGR